MLHVIGLLHPMFSCLGSVSTYLTSHPFNLVTVIKSMFTIAIIGCGVFICANYLEKYMQNKFFAKLTLSKFMKTAFVILFSLIGIFLFKIDLSTFSLFLGILGIGVAFSVHNVLTDLFHGFLLWRGRSIKPGNIVSIHGGQLYGIVNKLHARYVSIKTWGGKEYLIPNRDMISNTLENWSHTENRIGVEIAFKVSIHADPLFVENILKKIALSTNSVLDHPPPSVCFHALTDNYVDLFLRFWVTDLQGGVSDIRSEIILKVWKAFRKNEINMSPSSQESYGNLVDIKENKAINFP